MGTVRCSECILHKVLAKGCELAGKAGIVRHLTRVGADILKKENVAITETFSLHARLLTEQSSSPVRADTLSKQCGNRGERVARISSNVCEHDRACATLLEIPKCFARRNNTKIISHCPRKEWHIETCSHQNTPTTRRRKFIECPKWWTRE